MSVRADPDVPVGMVFMPFCYAEAAVNLLTNPALDPTGKIPEFKFCAVRVVLGDRARRGAAWTRQRLALLESERPRGGWRVEGLPAAQHPSSGGGGVHDRRTAPRCR